MRFLEKSLISLDVEASNAEDAIRAAGGLLVEGGVAEPSYVEAMLASYRDKGPYFVLAPHIALPHAKPEDGVSEASVSLVRLREPVRFGHASNDPVELVFALGSSTSSEHIALLRRLTALLNDPANVAAMKQAKTAEDVESLVQENTKL